MRGSGAMARTARARYWADMAEAQDFLTGQLLIAMPGMPDPRFAHSVIYMCMHDDRGAMGIIVNQIVDGLAFDKLLEQVGVEDKPAKRQIAVEDSGSHKRPKPKRRWLIQPAAAFAGGGGDEALLFHASERDVDAAALEGATGAVDQLQAVTRAVSGEQIENDGFGLREHGQSLT